MVSELVSRMEANLEAARVAMKAAQADPWVVGSAGQLKPHPGFGVAARCDAIATRLAVELRLLGALEPTSGPDPFAEFNPFDELRNRRTGLDAG